MTKHTLDTHLYVQPGVTVSQNQVLSCTLVFTVFTMQLRMQH